MIRPVQHAAVYAPRPGHDMSWLCSRRCSRDASEVPAASGSAPSSAAFCRGQGPPTSGPKWPFAPRERLRDDASGPGPRNAFLQKRCIERQNFRGGSPRRRRGCHCFVGAGRGAAAGSDLDRPPDGGLRGPTQSLWLSSLLRSARSGDKNEKYFLICIFSGDVSRRVLREVPRFYAVVSRR